VINWRQNVTFTQREFRDALGHFPTGVCVITLQTGPRVWQGMTVSSFNSVSLDPPLIVWSIGRSASLYGALLEAKGFTVNILSADCGDLANRFANSQTRTLDTIEAAFANENGVKLENSIMSFECSNWSRVEAGDHDLILGQVEAFCHGSAADPLCFVRGRMVRLASTPQTEPIA
jgi:flavin reductase (DIM6/NTAB) family NADH-FMN oxidoreductase RutF